MFGIYPIYEKKLRIFMQITLQHCWVENPHMQDLPYLNLAIPSENNGQVISIFEQLRM